MKKVITLLILICAFTACSNNAADDKSSSAAVMEDSSDFYTSDSQISSSHTPPLITITPKPTETVTPTPIISPEPSPTRDPSLPFYVDTWVYKYEHGEVFAFFFIFNLDGSAKYLVGWDYSEIYNIFEGTYKIENENKMMLSLQQTYIFEEKENDSLKFEETLEIIFEIEEIDDESMYVKLIDSNYDYVFHYAEDNNTRIFTRSQQLSEWLSQPGTP